VRGILSTAAALPIFGHAVPAAGNFPVLTSPTRLPDSILSLTSDCSIISCRIRDDLQSQYADIGIRYRNGRIPAKPRPRRFPIFKLVIFMVAIPVSLSVVV
jgi:hypothetical protein